MANCYKCGAPIKFAKRQGKLFPVSMDGSDHFDACKAASWEKVALSGIPFQDSKGRGFDFRGKRYYSEMVGPEIVGENYHPVECDCLPWDGCEKCCPEELTDADVEGLRILSLI
jgi:hypothetical protein